MEVRRLIKDLAKDHTIIFSTHILAEVAAVCERVVIINKGRLVADTLTKDLHLLAEKVGLKTAADLDALGMEQLFHKLTQ